MLKFDIEAVYTFGYHLSIFYFIAVFGKTVLFVYLPLLHSAKRFVAAIITLQTSRWYFRGKLLLEMEVKPDIVPALYSANLRRQIFNIFKHVLLRTEVI